MGVHKGQQFGPIGRAEPSAEARHLDELRRQYFYLIQFAVLPKKAGRDHSLTAKFL
jgi:hypothetical protein